MTYNEAYQQSINDKETFWESQAKAIDWYEFPKSILSQNDKGFYNWYKGGKLNTAYLALDYHVENGRADQTAIIYDSPVTNTKEQTSALKHY